MKTLSIATALLFAFGTVTFAQNATGTSKTSTTKTTTANVGKVDKGRPKMPKVPKKPVSGTVTPKAK